MQRFQLIPSESQPDSFVCTDSENLIVCIFENHKFNDTQKFETLTDFDPAKYMELARYVREMADWLRENHYEKVF